MDHKQFQTLVAVAEGIADELNRVGDLLEKRLNMDTLRLSLDLPLAIKAARLEVGLTQAQAAERMGIAKQYWCQMENGKKRPGPGTLQRVAQALGKQPWELAEGLSSQEKSKAQETEAETKMAATIRELVRLGQSIETVRAGMLDAALIECRGNKARVAQMLGVSRRTVRNWTNGGNGRATA